MMSLKLFVLLALLASVSANRELLQGELFDFFSFFGCVADVAFFCEWVGPTSAMAHFPPYECPIYHGR